MMKHSTQFLFRPFRLIDRMLRRARWYKRLPIFLQKTLAIFLTFSIVFTGTGIVYLFNPWGNTAEAAWFNDNWGYRKSYVLPTHSASENNVYVTLSLDTSTLVTAGKMQSDCDDIRFTQENGEILAYYIVSGCNTTTTSINVNFKTYPAGIVTIYFYYGNPSVSAGASAANFSTAASNNTTTLNKQVAASTDDAVEHGSAVGADRTWTSSNEVITNNGTANFFNSPGRHSIGDGDNTSMGARFTGITIPQGSTITSATYIMTPVSTWTAVNPPITYHVSAQDSDDAAAFSTTGGNLNATNRPRTTAECGIWTQTSVTINVEESRDVTSCVQEVIDRAGWAGTSASDIAILIDTYTTTGNTEWQDYESYDSTAGEAPKLNITYVTAISPTVGSEEKSPAPFSYWKFDDAQGSTAEDSTTNNEDVTLAASTANPTWSNEDVCISGKCLRFDGTNDYANSASAIDFSTTAVITVEFWLKWQPYTNDDDLAMEFSANTNTSTTGFYVDPNFSTSQVRILLKGDVGENSVEFSQPDGAVWNHYAIVMDKSQAGATEIVPYINGVPVSYTKTFSNNNTNNFGSNTLYFMSRAGGTPGASLFGGGMMDEVKIYTQSRTAAQIKADFNSRSNPEGLSTQFGNNPYDASEGGLSADVTHYYRMDETSWTQDCTTATAKDSAGSVDLLSCPSTTGPTTTSAGKYSYGGSFDGSNDYLEKDAAESYNKRWTVSLWYKTSDTAGYLFDTRNGSDAGANGVAVFTDGANTFSFYQIIGNVNTKYSNYTSATLDGNWHHLVVTRDGDNSISFYVDKVKLTGTPLISEVDISASSETWKGITFGARNGGTTYPLLGTLDEARFYKRNFTQNDTNTLYSYGPGPVGYWKLDEGSGTAAVDFSGNGNNGTLTNSPTRVQGKYGQALDFNAAGSAHVPAGSGSSLNITSGYTLEAWVKPTSNDLSPAWSDILSNYDSTGSTAQYEMAFTDSGVLNLGFGNGGYETYAAQSASFTAGNWYHVVATYDGNHNAKFYVNGVYYVATRTLGGSVTLPTSGFGNTTIGRAGDYNGQYFDGVIDEVKMYNYVRSASQVVEDMNAGHPAPGSPVGTPLGYWKFNEGALNMCSGGANDACNSGNGGITYDGAFNNQTGYSNAGKFGKAASFDGNNDFVQVTGKMGSQPAVTLTGWANITASDTGGSQLISIGDYVAIYAHDVGQGGVPSGVYFQTGSTWNVVVSNGGTTVGNGWHHYAYVVDPANSTQKLYVDGMLRGSGTDSDAIVYTGVGSNTFIGKHGNAGTTVDMNGQIDEVKVYNQALTADQVKLDMNRGSSQVLGALSDNATAGQVQAASQEYCIPGDSTTCTVPVGRWDLEEGSGTNAFDTSGNANTGTITAGSGGYTVGKVGKGYNYDGSATTINASSGTTLDDLTAASMSLEAWIYRRSIGEGSNGFILSKNNGPSQSSGWIFYATSGNAIDFIVDGSTDLRCVTANSVLTLNTWQHVAVTMGSFSSAASVNIYLNGVKQACSTSTNGNIRTSDAAQAFVIGNDSTTARTLDGYIDQVRVYNYARSQAQIAYDYNRGAPTAYWKMDECQGTTMNDSAGNIYSGTLTIGATGGEDTVGTCQTSSTAWGSGISGKRNYSVDLDGTDDYIQVSDTANLRFDAATADFSLFSWVKRGANGEMNVISKEDADNDGYRLQFTSGNVVRCSVDSIDIDSTLTITDTNWHHIGCTIDRDGNGQVYIDGQANGTATAISSEVMANTAALRLGTRAYTAANYLDGQLDETKIYNYVLTATQVKSLVNDGAARYGPLTGSP